MKKIKYLLIGFLLASALTITSDTRHYVGSHWLTWSRGEKYNYVMGYVMGNYTTIRLLIERGSITPSQQQPINFAGQRVEVIMKEIDDFYIQTGRTDWPIYIVVYVRNQWKYDDIPAWSGGYGGWK